jgi:tripeptidyl-peptidase I
MLPIHFKTSSEMPVMRLTLALLFSFAVCCRSSSELHQQELQKNAEFSLHSHIFKESMPLLSTRTDLIKRTSVQPDYIHELIFVVQQQNMEELTRILHDVSNPSSPNYGQHMSVEQVSAMTMNVPGRNAIVDYLHTNGATVTREILSGDLITAIAPVSVWEKVLDTKFYTFHQLQLEGHVQEVVGAEMYSIPRVLELHLQSVLNVIEMPAYTALGLLTRVEQKSKKGFRTQVTDPPGYLRPQEIREFYNMTTAFGSAQSTQSAVAFADNYFSPLSLAYFQEFISFQKLQPALTIGGFISDSPLDDSGEGNLDIQYLIGISPGSPTTFWHNDGGFNTWLNEVLNTPNPPLVLSMSYGMQESMVSAATHEAVTTAAKKLGIIGVTLVVASGDDGAVGTDSRSVPPVCAYQPYFPAGNPYFTAIGGTAVRLIR